MRALIVAYYFPPKGGAGTQRFAKFCKFLPEHGVESVVLTVDAAAKSPYAPHDDASLLDGASTRVLRVAAPERAPFGLRVQRALRFLVDHDEWAAAAAGRAANEAMGQRFDVVVTTLSPYACWRVGERLQRLGVPWVVDLRDPWSLDGWRVHATSLHARVDLWRMRRALKRADFVIANVPAAKAAFVELGADPARTVVVPNGFDEEDFKALTAPSPRDPRRFVLVHVGTLHGVDVAGGLTANGLRRVRHRQIEPLGRTGHFLLHAIAQWRLRAPASGPVLAVHLYGQVDASHRELIARLGIGDLVTLHGYVEHRASLAALANADAVFVPLHGVPPGERALVVPGKLYEALASERPVLAALPPGDGADLVRALDAGIVVPPTDTPALADALVAMTSAHARGEPRRGCARALLTPFRRRELTASLARVLNAAVARQRAVDVRDPWQLLGVSARS